MPEMSQLEWLMHKLEPHEALELKAACDSFLAEGPEAMPYCPACWVKRNTAESALIHEILASGFIWKRSPQGHDYWAAVHDKYKSLAVRRSLRE